MKAYEVLKRYKAGERDFRCLNLRGQSFKGKNLSGADFSQADIRGANFTNAKLTGANFRGAKAGLQRRWVIVLVIVSLLLAVVSGLISALAGAWISVFFSPDFTNQYGFTPAAIILFVYIIFFLFTIRRGFAAGAVIGTAVIAAIVAVVVAVVPAVVGTAALALAAVVAVAVAGVGAGAAIAVMAEAVLAAGVVPAAVVVAVAAVMTGAVAAPVALVVPATVTVLSIYLARRALAGDEKYAFIRIFAIAFGVIGGTSFRYADLTDADFTYATVKSTDFRRATLTRTRWHQAKKLDRIRPGTTYLQFPQVRQLLITGQGQAQNFDRQNLRGVNLQGANLADASFITADLSEANLQDADLSGAKLVQTQLDEADLTGATLTGATIEDWGITSYTKLDGVRCDYVFMRLPTAVNPDPFRKPDNWAEVFADGDFADFIQPLVDTHDLYHNQNVDPRAIAISFKQLAENHPEAELKIVAMEKRGQDKFLLKAKTAPDADHSELSAEYFAIYNQLKGLRVREITLLLEEKDKQIRRLENMVRAALERPNFYSSLQIEQPQNLGDKSQDVVAKYLALDQRLENIVMTALERPSSDSSTQIEQPQNLEAKLHDFATKFLQLAGARIKREDEQYLIIETITGSLSSYAPLPVLLTVDTPTDQDVIRLVELSEQLVMNRLERAGMLLYIEAPDTTARMEMAKIRLRDRFVLIPIPLASVEQALPNKFDCEGLLEEYIGRYLQRADFFDDKNAISDTFSFFGRTELLRRLGEELIRHQGIGLFGLRKSGKTSVLLQLGFLLREHLVIHIDLQRYGGYRYGAALFNDILQQLYTLESEVKLPQFEPFSQDKPATDLTSEFTRRVSAFAHALQGTKYKLPILCFLDEVERIIPTPEDHRQKAEEFNACFGALRVLSQEQRQLALLVADVHPDCNRINRWEQQGVPTNPVFSFFKEVFLPPFSEEDTQEMLTNIGKLMGLEFDEETPRRIHQQSGGHPFVCRQLARFLTEKIKEENLKFPKSGNVVIEWARAERYLEKSLTGKGELKNYLKKSIWEDLEKRKFEAAIIILQVLACNEDLREGITEQALLNRLKAKFTKNQCLDACIWLTDVGLLYHEEVEHKDFYNIRMPLLSRWIQMQMTDEEIEQCKIH
jgi:uncharacterized protein YjbI with pentapeptide repeats